MLRLTPTAGWRFATPLQKSTLELLSGPSEGPGCPSQTLDLRRNYNVRSGIWLAYQPYMFESDYSPIADVGPLSLRKAPTVPPNADSMPPQASAVPPQEPPAAGHDADHLSRAAASVMSHWAAEPPLERSQAAPVTAGKEASPGLPSAEMPTIGLKVTSDSRPAEPLAPIGTLSSFCGMETSDLASWPGRSKRPEGSAQTAQTGEPGRRGKEAPAARHGGRDRITGDHIHDHNGHPGTGEATKPSSPSKKESPSEKTHQDAARTAQGQGGTHSSAKAAAKGSAKGRHADGVSHAHGAQSKGQATNGHPRSGATGGPAAHGAGSQGHPGPEYKESGGALPKPGGEGKSGREIALGAMPTLTNEPIEFAKSDMSHRLPPAQPGEDAATRKQTEEQALRQLESDRAYAIRAVSQFRQAQTQHIAAVVAGAPSLLSRLSAVEQQAMGEVERALATQSQAVKAAVARERAQVQAATTEAKAKIEADYQASLASMLAALEAGRARIRGAQTAAQGSVQQSEQGELSQVAGLYAQADGAFRSAGEVAGSRATAMAAERAAVYRAGKINCDDSLLDGPLTDNRCEAQAEAAEKVGAAYRDELLKEAVKQAEALRAQRPTDEGAVHQVASEAAQSLHAVCDNSLHGLEDAHRESVANAGRSRAALLDSAEQALQSTLSGLASHEQSQLAKLHGQGTQRQRAIRAKVEQAKLGIKTSIDRMAEDFEKGLSAFVAGLRGAEVPDPKALDRALGESGQQMSAQVQGVRANLEQSIAQAVGGIHAAGEKSAAALVEASSAAIAAAKQTSDAAHKSMVQLASTGGQSLRELIDGHRQASDGNASACEQGLRNIVSGVQTGYGQLNERLRTGSEHNAQAVQEGLINAVEQGLPDQISNEAQKAYDQVKPRWQSVLKWVLIIAVVLVVAIVLGPMVIGAVTGLAAGLGASAAVAGVVGTVVGGAIVGAATGAATTVIDNAFAGRDLTTGLGTAIALGALGGAIGGGVSSLLAGPMQGMTQLARFGVQVGVDMTIDTGINLATGNFSWQNFGTSLFMSLLTNGISAHPRIQAISQSTMSRGYGAGFDAGIALNPKLSSSPIPPGNITLPADRADHVNQGDTAGPGSPLAGKWNMRGGGHNANEIIPRAQSEGMTNSTVARDPITGVAIENFQIAVPAKSVDKSLFPPGMERGHIETAAITGVQRALSGAPGTSITPPTHPGGNYKFTATVTTPEGHPIVIEGYYRMTPLGHVEIQSVYPHADLNAGTIPVVPGSRDVPMTTYATPPDPSQGDRKRK